MKDKVDTTKPNQRGGIGNKLVTPEMRQQVLRIADELEDCDDRVAGQLEILNNMREALDIARQTARCLLKTDPFAAWEKIEQLRDKEFNAICGPFTGKKQSMASAKATPGAERLITRQMRQQIIDAKEEIANYAKVLTAFFDDVAKLESHTIAMDWADGLKCREPLESAAARKEREDAEREEELHAKSIE